MSTNIVSHIVCLAETPDEKEKFSELAKSISGWGIEKLYHASTTGQACRHTRELGKKGVLLVINTPLTEKGVRPIQFSDRLRRLTYTMVETWGMTRDQILVLKGDESPLQIEILVRMMIRRYMALASEVDILLPL